MTIVLSALTVAFAAICVWLTVRIVNRLERRAMWTLACLTAAFITYPASYPWIYLGLDGISTNRKWLWTSIDCLYEPMSVLQQTPESIQEAYAEYWFWCGTRLKRMGLACKDWRP